MLTSRGDTMFLLGWNIIFSLSLPNVACSNGFLLCRAWASRREALRRIPGNARQVLKLPVLLLHLMVETRHLPNSLHLLVGSVVGVGQALPFWEWLFHADYTAGPAARQPWRVITGCRNGDHCPSLSLLTRATSCPHGAEGHGALF